jgi:DNA-binding PadR family transcriptional regulator
MSSKHALLGLLLDRPGYPYQLGDRLEQRLGPNWRVDSGTLYNTVKAMEEDRLIERVESVPTPRGDRHVYSITDRGVREFERWFDKTPDAVRLPRRPLMLKITFAGPDRLAQAIGKLDDYERECAERLSAIAGMHEALPAAEEELLRADHLLLRVNLSSDIYALKGELRWAQNSRELLTWLSEQEHAVWPNGAGRQNRTASASARTQLFTRIARAGSDREEHPNTPRELHPAPKRDAG